MDKMFWFENFDRVKIYLMVEYSKKDIVKKYHGKWDNEKKLWYIIRHYNIDIKDIKCNIYVLSQFKIIKIEHNYYNNNYKQDEFNKILKYYLDLQTKSKECGIEYDF